MLKKTCPYCGEPAEAGQCPGCKAMLGESDLVLRDVAATVADESAPCEKYEKPQDSEFKTALTKKSAAADKVTKIVRDKMDMVAPDAALRLGVAYLSGVGVAADEKLAYELFYSAATRGNSEAYYHLGECYRLGRGVEADEERAKFFYTAGAQAGDQKCVGTLKVRYAINTVGGMACPQTPSGGDFVGLVDRLYTNVVRVIASSHSSSTRSCGSGAIVTGDYVVTNAHVVASGNGRPLENVSVMAGDDSRAYPCNVLVYAANEDVAILGFAGEKPPAVYGERLLLRSARTVKAGEEVFTIGNPNNMGLNVSKGIISRAAERDGSGREVLRTDMTINHGNSGGPLFDACGNVVGFMTYTISEASGEKLGDMSFAVTSDTAQSMIMKI